MNPRHGQIAALIEVGRWSEAASAAAAALAEEPGDGPLLGYLAQAQLGLRDPHAALATARRFVAAHPDDPWAHRVMTVAQFQIDGGDPVPAARELLRLAPDNWQSYQLLAQALGRTPQHRDEARAVAARALELAPWEPDAHFAVGYVAQRSGDKRAARAAYERVLELEPDHAMALNNMGTLDADFRADRSASNYASALRADPQSVIAQRNLHGLITKLTVNLYIGETAALVLVTVLAAANHGATTLSRVLGVVFALAEVGYIAAVVRRVPGRAWRHTTAQFGVPGRALWNLVPLTVLWVAIGAGCYGSDGQGIGSRALVPVLIVIVLLVRRNRR